ncbi:MAG: hypothetical protein LBV60_13055 [Streptomyces sp.]|jgi:NADPH:quinone reductase-like Zn-dependent oxidoreductase|nr:hypothetical protein [Streptomyces sp.]
MQALMFNPDLSLGRVPDPVPTPSQALVEVSAIALNFGEVAFRGARPAPGHVPGWDAAGVIIRQAADGSGGRIAGCGRA